ncbi:MAG: sigma-70 family RNA polymerase sigma factor [Oscillospiraceae bacterium]|nr:sigma-70 family RNA polymerase sigma factor [Oscillospiraceae bacterium]
MCEMLEDPQIIQLYWDRDTRAIAETDVKYGRLCNHIAMNILENVGDAEECVNDTYYRAWDAIPPQRPESFSSFLGRIVRNIALDRYRYNHARKRSGKMDVLLSELEDCIPSGTRTEELFEAGEVSALIDRFLDTLEKQRRNIFVRRYWYSQPIREIARACGMTEGQVKSILFRLRNLLRTALEKEGVAL